MTTIAEKLLIKPNSTIWLNEPAHLSLLAPMPAGVRESGMLATAGTAVLFAHDTASVRSQLGEHQTDLDKPSAFWVAFPAGSLDREALEPIVAEFGMRPGEQIAIDPHWCALQVQLDRG